MNQIKLRKAYSERGAAMGRPNFLPADRAAPVKLRLIQLRLDAGGYDAGGAYWGVLMPRAVTIHGVARTVVDKLYWAESVEDFELGPYDRPPVGNIEMVVGASNRHDAKEKIREELPNARFY